MSLHGEINISGGKYGKNGKAFCSDGYIGFGLSLFGCAGDSSSSSAGGSVEVLDVCANGSLPSVTDSTIIKNKVVFINGSDDVYYEYLKFTSSTAGEYSIYKQEDDDLVLQSSFEGTAIPSTFTYDEDTGLVSTGAGGNYIFEAGSDFGVASEILSVASGTDTDKLFQEWVTGNSDTFVFSEIGTLAIISNGSTAESGADFSNKSGWITAGELSFCWVKIAGEKKLYFNAYKTERSEVSEVGRALNSDGINLVSSKFLFLK